MLRKPIPCPVCGDVPVMVEKTYEHVYLIGDFYRCKIKCPSCGNTVIRTSDESAGHARHAAVETWNQGGGEDDPPILIYGYWRAGSGGGHQDD